MGTMLWSVVITVVLLIPAAFGLLVMLAVRRSVLGMEAMRLEALDPAELSGLGAEAIGRHHAYAEANGFAYLGCFRAISPDNPVGLVGAWQKDATFLCCYVTPWPAEGPVQSKVGTDFVTQYARDCVLTTGSSPDALFFPTRAGAYREALTGLSIGAQHAGHRSSDAHLRQSFRLRPEVPKQAFVPLFEGAIKREMEHVRSHFAWNVRAIFWYLGRARRVNKPIGQQRLMPPEPASGMM